MTATVEQFIGRAMMALADSPTPRLDTEVLVMHVTGLTRAQLITHANHLLTTSQESTLNELLERRARGEPVAYLTGTREFWSMALHVTPDVLIPRPETELLVEQALTRIPSDASWMIADLGTGSGAIALALAKERPRCRVIATDASERALTVARANAARLKIRNVEFRQGEWCTPLVGMQFDLIVSNPPYVAEGDPHLLQGDVRFEPRSALTAGQDGLDAMRDIIATAAHQLRPGGWLLTEHGSDQDEPIARLFIAGQYTNVMAYQDLAGHPRLTAGRIARH